MALLFFHFSQQSSSQIRNYIQNDGGCFSLFISGKRGCRRHGNNGFNSLGRILNGTVNPFGHGLSYTSFTQEMGPGRNIKRSPCNEGDILPLKKGTHQEVFRPVYAQHFKSKTQARFSYVRSRPLDTRNSRATWATSRPSTSTA